MRSIITQNPDALGLLWAVPVLILLYVAAARKRRDALRAFASAGMLHHLVDGAVSVRRGWKGAASVLAFACLAIALAGPAWNPQPQAVQREGRDVIFMLDVSKSMLAKDLEPSRLERAKSAISDCLNELRGDRVALVAFAGTAAIQCPLTMDYAFFKMRLNSVEPDDLVQGGTRIGDAITTVIETVLEPERADRQDIILISDGEDHDSTPEAAAQSLTQAGARLIAIGIGDSSRGMRIPVKDEDTGLQTYLVHNDQEVWTKLDASTMRRMVNATKDGVYLEVGTGTIDLPAVYRQLIATAKSQVLEDQTLLQYEEKFQVFLGFAFLLLLLAAASGNAGKNEPGAKRIWEGPRASLLLLCAGFVLASNAGADSVASIVADGNAAYENEEYATAVEHYYDALNLAPESPVVLYDLGNVYYRQRDFESAMEAFENAAYLSDNEELRAKAFHNLGNCLYKTAEMQREMDLMSAASLCLMSARYYRAALGADPARQDSAHNLEVAKRMAAALEEEQKANEDRQKQLQEAMQEIVDTLVDLIARQEAIKKNTHELGFADSDEKIPRLLSARQDQGQLRTDTAALVTRMEEVDAMFMGLDELPEGMPADLGTPLAEPRKFVQEAVTAEDEAIARLDETALPRAEQAQQDAIDALRKAIEAMPTQPQDDQGEGDESEEQSDEENYEESEEQGDQQAREVEPEQPPDSDEFTAPKESPEDILNEEQENNSERKAKRPDHYQAVDKDW